jgi:hypothetical protein
MEIDGKRYPLEGKCEDNGKLSAKLDGTRLEGRVIRSGNRIEVFLPGEHRCFELRNPPGIRAEEWIAVDGRQIAAVETEGAHLGQVPMDANPKPGTQQLAGDRPGCHADHGLTCR